MSQVEVIGTGSVLLFRPKDVLRKRLLAKNCQIYQLSPHHKIIYSVALFFAYVEEMCSVTKVMATTHVRKQRRLLSCV